MSQSQMNNEFVMPGPETGSVYHAAGAGSPQVIQALHDIKNESEKVLYDLGSTGSLSELMAELPWVEWSPALFEGAAQDFNGQPTMSEPSYENDADMRPMGG